MQSMHSIQYLKTLRGSERDRIALDAGLSASYVSRLVATQAPYVPLELAVACDKHSLGKCDFRTSLKPTRRIDWDHVRHRLNQ